MTTSDTTEKPAKVPMVVRNLRIPRDLWDAAAAKGASEDPPRRISDVVRDHLTDYVETP